MDMYRTAGSTTGGFGGTQVAEAGLGEEEQPGAPSRTVAVADEVEVARVLAASTDYAVLQVQPGTAATDIKRRFREMAISLHPDKCKVRLRCWGALYRSWEHILGTRASF
jgi:DnaJ domain